MTKKICLDANILTSYLSLDENYPDVDELLKQISKKSYLILVPALANFEVANSLAKKERLRIMTAHQIQSALEIFFTLPILLVWQNDYLQNALDIQRQGLPSIFDAAYLSTAQLQNIPLITRDKDLIKKGKKIYPAVFSPKQWLQTT